MKHSRRDEKYLSKPKVFRKPKVEPSMNLETLFAQYEEEEKIVTAYTIKWYGNYLISIPNPNYIIKNYSP